MIKVYTSTTCPTCKAIKMKLGQKNIPYEETHDIEPLKDKHLLRLPVMEFEDGSMLVTPTDMSNWIKAYGE